MSQSKRPLTYKRILLKLSGQVLAGTGSSYHGLDFEVVSRICDEIIACTKLGMQIALVIGGSNFWHSAKDVKNIPGNDLGVDRICSDQMGMLATTINALALNSVLTHKGADVRVLSAIDMKGIAELYIRNRAVRHLEKGRIVIISSGTGDPLFSTDAAAMLRAAELGVNVVLLGKDVDGVYSVDPESGSATAKCRAITYDKVMASHHDVIDTTAASMGHDNKITTLLFSPATPGNILRAANGEVVGTTIY